MVTFLPDALPCAPARFSVSERLLFVAGVWLLDTAYPP
jgi:hypothetical protein